MRLISPFVGKSEEWKLKNDDDKHPGVLIVKNIYNYFRKYKHDTIVMAGPICMTEECEELCGCDRLCICPEVLDKMLEL